MAHKMKKQPINLKKGFVMDLNIPKDFYPVDWYRSGKKLRMVFEHA